jgi:hypothetical protein
MEGEELFEGLDASFLDSGEDAGFDTGFDPITGEVYTDKPAKDVSGENPELKKELEFVNNEETTEANEGSEEGSTVEGYEDIDEETPDSEESPSSPLTSLTSALREDGVLSSLSEDEVKDIKSGKDLIKVLRKQIEDNEYSDLSEDQQEYLKALRTGVPDNAYREAKNTVTRLNELNPEQLESDSAENFRRQVLVRDFVNKGFDEAEAEKYAARSAELGEDIEDSKKALERLKDTEAQRLKLLSSQAEQKQKTATEDYNRRVNDLKLKVDNTKEILPNVKINENTQGKVFDLMTKTAGYDRNNNPVNAVVKNMMEDQEYLVKLNYLHVLTDGFKDFSSLTGTVGSSAVHKLDKALQAQDARLKSGASEKQGKKRASGLLSALDGIL